MTDVRRKKSGPKHEASGPAGARRAEAGHANVERLKAYNPAVRWECVSETENTSRVEWPRTPCIAAWTASIVRRQGGHPCSERHWRSLVPLRAV
jgi:hypothetical protein